jgi:hypothetical protein
MYGCRVALPMYAAVQRSTAFEAELFCAAQSPSSSSNSTALAPVALRRTWLPSMSATRPSET